MTLVVGRHFVPFKIDDSQGLSPNWGVLYIHVYPMKFHQIIIFVPLDLSFFSVFSCEILGDFTPSAHGKNLPT